MKIQLIERYKSLHPFVSELLSDFTIITGKNGSGKSQLFEALTVHEKSNERVRAKFEPNIFKIQIEGLEKKTINSIGNTYYKSIVDKQIEYFRENSSIEIKEFIDYIFRNNLDPETMRSDFQPRDPGYNELVNGAFKHFFGPGGQRGSQLHLNSPIIEKEHYILNKLISTESKLSSFNFLREQCLTSNKSLVDLLEADFYANPVRENYIDTNNLFTSNIELIFYSYAKRRSQNRIQHSLQLSEQEPGSSIPDSEFIEKFPPPWLIINDILDRYGIDFHFKPIGKKDFTIELDFQLQIIKKSLELPIPPEQLSSGEKIIIGLIIKMFTSDYYNANLSFPELILLDEPDAHLHPELSKLLIDVLEQTFVNNFGIKVIMTTHSPSTIALATEGTIFQLTNGVQSSLKAISKDDALKLLTSFIPTLNIDYKNHRQVFVESPTDCKYYTFLYQKLVLDKERFPSLRHKLYFMSGSYGQGNCDQVIKVVSDFRGSGNETCFGIIDWDPNGTKRNSSTDTVLVHGENERYSLENYLLDPLYLSILFIESNGANGIYNLLNILETENQYDLWKKDEETLQTYYDIIFGKITDKYPHLLSQNEAVTIEYLDGNSITFPQWFVQTKGHLLQIKIFEVFPSLKGKYGTHEGLLQADLSTIAAKCYPYVPKSSIDILIKLCN